MTDKPKLPSGQTVTWNEEKMVTYYSNLIGISMTPFDIGIIFGQIGKATGTDIEGLSLAKIILSPEQAQNLIKLLMISVTKYMQTSGELRAAGAVDEESFLEALQKNESPHES